MSTFYSTKLNKNVNIPADKVCGYTMTRHTNRRGNTSGLRAGLNNGVVRQRLSRFATEADAKCNFPCDGNTNWLNRKRGTDFYKTREGEAFEIKRPMTKSGTVALNFDADNIPPNNRRGHGNYDIVRPSTDAAKIAPRMHTDFDKLQSIDLLKFGPKIRLSEDSLEKFFTIMEADPTDEQWLQEKARMVTELKAKGMNDEDIKEELKQNKPLGREQRTNKVKRNIAQSALSFEKKLMELTQEIKEGRAESLQQKARLIGQFSVLLNNASVVSRTDINQLNDIKNALNRLNIPTNPQDIGVVSRFFDAAGYEDISGIINTSIINNTPTSDLQRPIRDLTREDKPKINLKKMRELLNRPSPDRHFLDVKNRSIINTRQLQIEAERDTQGGILGPNFSLLRKIELPEEGVNDDVDDDDEDLPLLLADEEKKQEPKKLSADDLEVIFNDIDQLKSDEKFTQGIPKLAEALRNIIPKDSNFSIGAEFVGLLEKYPISRLFGITPSLKNDIKTIIQKLRQDIGLNLVIDPNINFADFNYFNKNKGSVLYFLFQRAIENNHYDAAKDIDQNILYYDRGLSADPRLISVHDMVKIIKRPNKTFPPKGFIDFKTAAVVHGDVLLSSVEGDRKKIRKPVFQLTGVKPKSSSAITKKKKKKRSKSKQKGSGIRRLNARRFRRLH
jgi:hypothetical protein